WSTAGLAKLLSRHGTAVGIGVALFFAVIIGAGWYIDRGPIPPAPGGQPPAGWDGGAPRSWTFASADPGSPAQALLGAWTDGPHGECNVPPGHVWPGSGQMGLLALDP